VAGTTPGIPNHSLDTDINFIGISMYKQISFVIPAAIMLTAIVTVALYTVNEAKAQGNATGANMTKK
jgi:hypothetical protein